MIRGQQAEARLLEGPRLCRLVIRRPGEDHVLGIPPQLAEPEAQQGLVEVLVAGMHRQAQALGGVAEVAEDPQVAHDGARLVLHHVAPVLEEAQLAPPAGEVVLDEAQLEVLGRARVDQAHARRCAGVVQRQEGLGVLGAVGPQALGRLDGLELAQALGRQLVVREGRVGAEALLGVQADGRLIPGVHLEGEALDPHPAVGVENMVEHRARHPPVPEGAGHRHVVDVPAGLLVVAGAGLDEARDRPVHFGDLQVHGVLVGIGEKGERPHQRVHLLPPGELPGHIDAAPLELFGERPFEDRLESGQVHETDRTDHREAPPMGARREPLASTCAER
ncbi:hypothetical protein D3C86_1365910 [compost metagenome]